MVKAEKNVTARGAQTGRVKTTGHGQMIAKVEKVSGPVKHDQKLTKLKKAGGSIVMTVPAHVRHALNLAAGDTVKVAAEKGRIVVEPVRERRKLSLDEILAKCNPDAPRSAEEQAWHDMKPDGGEIW